MSSSSSRPASSSTMQRRTNLSSDTVVDAILAGRQKKESFLVPDLQSHTSKRPSKILLSQEDFSHLMGEVDGSLYGSMGRPELDVLVINNSVDQEHLQFLDLQASVFLQTPVAGTPLDRSKPPSRAASARATRPTSSTRSRPSSALANGAADTAGTATAPQPVIATLEGGIDPETIAVDHVISELVAIEGQVALPSSESLPLPERDFDEGGVTLLYDPVRHLFILTQALEIALMKLAVDHLPRYAQWRRDFIDSLSQSLALSPISEESASLIEELRISPPNGFCDREPGQGRDAHEIVIVRSYCMLGNARHNTTEPLRDKLWRRFLQREIFPLFDDTTRFKDLCAVLCEEWKEQHKEELGLNRVDEALVEISDDSDSDTKKKRKKKGKGKKSKGKKKKDKKKASTLASGSEDDDTSDDGTDDHEDLTTDDESVAEKQTTAVPLEKPHDGKIPQKHQSRKTDMMANKMSTKSKRL